MLTGSSFELPFELSLAGSSCWKMPLPAEVVDCFTERAAAKDVFNARHASLNTIVFLANNFVQIHIGPCLLAQVLSNLLSSVLQEALSGKCRSLQKCSTARYNEGVSGSSSLWLFHSACGCSTVLVVITKFTGQRREGGIDAAIRQRCNEVTDFRVLTNSHAGRGQLSWCHLWWCAAVSTNP